MDRWCLCRQRRLRHRRHHRRRPAAATATTAAATAAAATAAAATATAASAAAASTAAASTARRRRRHRLRRRHHRRRHRRHHHRRPPPPSATVGYAAQIQMGSPPAGAVYTFNPDNPGANQSAINRGNFTSDFAGFVQGSVETTRTDTPFRVLFRKDVSPNPARIEVILELGHPTTDGSAANAGPFTLTIFEGATQVFQGAFPSMGWFTRWRWNPTPRPEVRTRASLLPGNLNLVPNFSQSLATTFRAADCGNPGSGSYVITTYSSAYAPGEGNNLNLLGINENCGIATETGGVGGRPELGIVTEWQANYIVDGNSAAQTAMYVLAEVAGGMPWIIRDTDNRGACRFHKPQQLFERWCREASIHRLLSFRPAAEPASGRWR